MKNICHISMHLFSPKTSNSHEVKKKKKQK